MEVGYIMNENCINDEKLVIKFAPWMKKKLKVTK
jgi:hypothetical protein